MEPARGDESPGLAESLGSVEPPSRHWAAKGTLLLGVRAVLATSYERIHRSNLIGMGVLPLQFRPGESAQTLRLTGEETYTIARTSSIMTFKSAARR